MKDDDRPKVLTPEETVLWLESYRQLIFEIWRENPALREEWARLRALEDSKPRNTA